MDEGASDETEEDRLDRFRQLVRDGISHAQEVRESTQGMTDFRVPPSGTETGDDLVWEVVERIYFGLATPYEPDARLDQITPGQRAAYALYWMTSEVGNGGLHQYFYNSTGYLMPEAIEGAELVGATDLARELRRAAEHLGRPYPRDRDVRVQVLERLPGPGDAFWDSLDDAVWPLLERLGDEELGSYIESHTDQFFLPG